MPLRCADCARLNAQRHDLRQGMPRFVLAEAREFLGPPLQLDRRWLCLADSKRSVLELEHETCERAALVARGSAHELQREAEFRVSLRPLRLETCERRGRRFGAHAIPSARGKPAGRSTT